MSVGAQPTTLVDHGLTATAQDTPLNDVRRWHDD